MHEEYLGDGVYVHYDGYHIVLSVDPMCSILLDPAVFLALVDYEKKVGIKHD